jgi:competence protein ComEC
VKPREVICSTGWQNRYRFPHAEVLERYRQRGIRIWRTDLQGAIEIRTRGSGMQIRPMLDAPRAPAAGEDA